jgi:hypothetical protein
MSGLIWSVASLRQALEARASSMRLARPGPVQPSELPTEEHAVADIAIHMYNISFPLFEANYKRKMSRGADIPFRQVGAYHKSTPKQIVQAVKDVLGRDRVAVMRIMSHGNSGFLNFPGLEDQRYISMAYVDLRSAFAPPGRLEIHGCAVASETDTLKPGANPDSPRRSDAVDGTFTGNKNGRGLVYLKRVASFFNVPTVGAVDVQSPETWSYERNTVTAYPFSDKFFMDTEDTRIWDFEAQNRAASAYEHRIINDFAKAGLYRQALQMFKELAKTYPNSGAGQRARRIIDTDDVEALVKPMQGR